MRVLVVEDVRSLADDIAEGLRDEAMAVDIAYDGLQAAVKIDTTNYDVVVLDRDLPGLHGDLVCRKIAEGTNPAMVLMLTAAGASRDRVAGLRLGADDYLPKPFDFDELVLRIRGLARRRPTMRPRTIQTAGVELDAVRRTVRRDGRHVELSPKESAVLEALMHAAPATLSTIPTVGYRIVAE